MAAAQALPRRCNARAQAECYICWSDVSQGARVVALSCEHVFHDGCLVAWLSICASCPICRTAALPARSLAKDVAGFLFLPLLGPVVHVCLALSLVLRAVTSLADFAFAWLDDVWRRARAACKREAALQREGRRVKRLGRRPLRRRSKTR